MYYVYILKCNDNTLYTGITNDLNNRIKKHNNGTASKYTRARLPVKYTFICSVADKSEALKLEIKIKKLTKSKKLELIHSDKNEINTSKNA